MARRRKGAIPTVEWIGGAMGVAIVLATVAYLTFETIRDRANEAILGVSVVRVREQGGSFAVEVAVHNSGRAAAADVHIAAPAASIEGHHPPPQARIDYVPGLSTRYATLVFSSNPGERPHVRVVGYSKP
jgi:uncharacterized protein (TIGR02588 family)